MNAKALGAEFIGTFALVTATCGSALFSAPSGGGLVGAAALMVVGICVVGTFGLTMVLSQLYLPRHVGMASGLSIGLAMGLGGIAAVALGGLADAVDLKTALVCSAFAPLLGAVLCLFLPAPRATLPVATVPSPAYPLLD